MVDGRETTGAVPNQLFTDADGRWQGQYDKQILVLEKKDAEASDADVVLDAMDIMTGNSKAHTMKNGTVAIEVECGPQNYTIDAQARIDFVDLCNPEVERESVFGVRQLSTAAKKRVIEKMIEENKFI